MMWEAISASPVPAAATSFLGIFTATAAAAAAAVFERALGQGLALVHFSAQLERFVWDRGCA